MQYIPGIKVTSIGPLRRLDLDGAALADQLFQGYLDQILVEGFFHADPHPGNVLLTDDSKLALVDVGMVARVPKAMRETLVRLLLALSDGNGVAVAEGAMTLGEARPGFDRRAFCRAVTELIEREEGLNVSELDAGTTIAAILRISGNTGLRLPAELSLLGKALLNLDMVARSLDPGFQPAAAIKAHSHEIMQNEMTATTGNVFSALLDARDFVEQFPGRVNRVMDALADGNFHLDVKAFDETELLRGLHKVANRLTMGLVLAALIVGAAMLMRVPTSSKLLGYPSVAIVCFFIACGAGMALLVSIVRSDRRIKGRATGRRQ
jgi:predicted unusual protein kinase regulating ubiquinone biosynthesis (AarF/ABC1/UbiB family)